MPPILLTISPLHQTLRSLEERKWSLTEEALACHTNSPWQHLRKCIEIGMENMHTDVRVVRVKTMIAHIFLLRVKSYAADMRSTFSNPSILYYWWQYFLLIFNLLKQFISNFQVTGSGKTLAFLIPIVEMLRATLKAGTVEWRNGGKWPQILKHGTAENDPKS